jgi:hypothetical protein
VIYKQPKPGDRYRPIVTVLKVKKSVPTIIRVSGREYVLRTPDQFNQRRQGAVKRDRTTSH